MAHGSDELSRLIEEAGWKYPVPVRQLEQEYALDNVAVDEEGNMVMVAELLSHMDVDRFKSEEHLRETVTPICNSIHRSRQRSIIDRIGDLLGK